MFFFTFVGAIIGVICGHFDALSLLLLGYWWPLSVVAFFANVVVCLVVGWAVDRLAE